MGFATNRYSEAGLIASQKKRITELEQQLSTLRDAAQIVVAHREIDPPYLPKLADDIDALKAALEAGNEHQR